MRKRSLRKKVVALSLVVVTTFTAPAFSGKTVLAADPSIATNIFHLTGINRTKADNVQKALLEILKLKEFKTVLSPYIGPAVAVLDVFLNEGTTTLGDINHKLDEINAEIQGKVEKEADRIIAVLDTFPDALNISACKRNLKAVQRGIGNAQNNISSDLNSKLSDEDKIRIIASGIPT